MFLHLAVEIDVQGSRLWGEFVPSPQSLHQCAFVCLIWCVPKFHQYHIRRETPIEAADEAIIDGAWVQEWMGERVNVAEQSLAQLAYKAGNKNKRRAAI